MPISSWLFIRGRESIWIERPYGLSLIVAGPGPARAHLVFPNEDALQAYQVVAAERFTQAGWFLWGFDEQRRQRAERVAIPASTASTSTGSQGAGSATIYRVQSGTPRRERHAIPSRFTVE
jgi:hypothetical protein